MLAWLVVLDRLRASARADLQVLAHLDDREAVEAGLELAYAASDLALSDQWPDAIQSARDAVECDGRWTPLVSALDAAFRRRLQ